MTETHRNLLGHFHHIRVLYSTWFKLAWGLGFKNGLPAKLLVSEAFTGDAYIDELISATLASRSQLREA